MLRKVMIDPAAKLAVCYPWHLDNTKRVIEHEHTLSVIQYELDLLRAADEPLLLVIEGASGSGKSILANLLASTGQDCQLLNFIQMRLTGDMTGVDEALRNAPGTVVVDEAGVLGWDAKVPHQMHVDSGGIAVLFMQDQNTIDWELGGTHLRLTHDGLKLVRRPRGVRR